MSIQEKTNELKILVSEEVDEVRILREGENALDLLRRDWKTNQRSFTADDISSLKAISETLAAIKSFIVEHGDFEYISSKEEVDEVVGRLYRVVEKVSGLTVSGRVNKEIRELIERKQTLPSRAAGENESELKRAMAILNSNAPACKKCGRNMVLREGDGDYFWGCPTFPDCWGKKRLKREELELLPNFL